MTTPQPIPDHAPEDRRAATGELSWMLWTAIGIGGIWVAVLRLSLLAPDLVSGSEQEHLPVAAFTTWFWGGVGTLAFLWATARLRGSARRQPIWIGLSVVTLVLWAVATILGITLPVTETAPIRHGSPSPPYSRQSPQRYSPPWRAPSPTYSVTTRGTTRSPRRVVSQGRSAPSPIVHADLAPPAALAAANKQATSAAVYVVLGERERLPQLLPAHPEIGRRRARCDPPPPAAL